MSVNVVNMLKKNNFEHGDILVHYAKSFHINGMSFEDLIQEGAIAYIEAERSFNEDKGSLRGFIGLCVKRHLISQLKKSKTEKRRMYIESLSLEKKNEDDDDLYGCVPDNTDLEKEVIKKEKLEKVYKLIDNTFSELERDCFLMFLNGYSYEEITDELGIHEKSVDNALVRARRKINENSNRRT